MVSETSAGLGRMLGPLARIGAAALYNFTVVPVVLLRMPVLTFLFVMNVCRLFLVLPFLISWHDPPALDYLSLLLVSSVSFFLLLEAVFFLLAAVFLPLGLSVMLLSLAPIITLTITAIVRLQLPRSAHILSSAVCLAGAFIAFEPWTGGTGTALGYVSVSIATLSEALLPLTIESLRTNGVAWQDQVPLVALSIDFFLYPIFAILAVCATGSINGVFRPGESLRILSVYPFIVVASAVGHAIGDMLYTIAFAVVPDLVVSTIATFACLVFAVLVQVVILHEPASYYQLSGASLVFIGLTGLTYSEMKEEYAGGNRACALPCTRSTDQQAVPLLDASAPQVASVSGLIKSERVC